MEHPSDPPIPPPIHNFTDLHQSCLLQTSQTFTPAIDSCLIYSQAATKCQRLLEITKTFEEHVRVTINSDPTPIYNTHLKALRELLDETNSAVHQTLQDLRRFRPP